VILSENIGFKLPINMARVNKTRYALLGFLSMRSSSGYDIKKLMEQSTNHFWREGDSSIYPIFKQLLDEGMVTCELINIESGKPKKVYTITDDGQHELEEWLLRSPELFQSRNELILKIFFGWNVDRDITIGHLKEFRNKVKSLLNQYRNMAKRMPSTTNIANDKLHRFLTLRAGIIYSEASLAWCDEAVRLLENEAD